ncbi:NAD(P)/FAD-dependent oxidoreductase [Eubacteriales bacterium OttesenSCG-928-N13]|nr:NAD(P)/FAD-dependent oxidoreductase [Eubacteriales bacterium OttesenSCG-928-N13]
MMKYDVVVIGGGPAGLAAAIEAKKGAPEQRVLILERDQALGGILQQCIHNGFGLHYFKEELTGPEYAERFIEQLDGSGIEVFTDTMVLELSKDRRVLAVSREHGLIEIEAGAVVLAMGCRERTRGALNIPGARPAGVFTAGCAQRLVNMEGYLPGRRVVVLGSGDIGLIMARRMTWSGATVALVAELMPYSSGLNRNIVQCLTDNNIPLKFNHTVTQIHGRERLSGVTVAEVDPMTRKPIPGSEQMIECDTLLLSVGLIPENELTQGAGISISPITSGALVDERRETDIEGIFACGNVLHVHDLVDNVSEEATIAGRAAADYVKQGALSGPIAQVRTGRGVRYAVPQRVHAGGEGKLDLYFRVDNAYRGMRVQLRSGDQLLLDRKKQIMTPGEMEKITIDASKVTGDLELMLAEG